MKINERCRVCQRFLISPLIELPTTSSLVKYALPAPASTGASVSSQLSTIVAIEFPIEIAANPDSVAIGFHYDCIIQRPHMAQKIINGYLFDLTNPSPGEPAANINFSITAAPSLKAGGGAGVGGSVQDDERTPLLSSTSGGEETPRIKGMLGWLRQHLTTHASYIDMNQNILHIKLVRGHISVLEFCACAICCIPAAMVVGCVSVASCERFGRTWQRFANWWN